SLPATPLISSKLHKQVQQPGSLAQTSRRGEYFNFTIRRCQHGETPNLGRDLGPIDPWLLSPKRRHFPRLASIVDPCRQATDSDRFCNNRQSALKAFLLVLAIQTDAEPAPAPFTPTMKEEHALRPRPALHMTTRTKRQPTLK